MISSLAHPELQSRVEAAETALHNVALSHPDALVLLEAGVARTAAALEAAAAVALIGDGPSGGYVRCAGFPPDTAPELQEWGPLVGTESPRPTTASGGELAERLGHPFVLVLPVYGDPPGLFVLARDTPWTDAEEHAGVRLAALFDTLWSWVETESRFQRTVADLDDALFTFGYDGGRRAYTFASPQVEAITGLDPDAVLAGDADWADLVIDEDREAFEVHNARLQSGEASRLDVRLRVEGGDVVWVSERATPSVDTVGRPVVGGLLADVTAQKEAEAQLDRARRVAERAAQTRMSFLRTMSHELRTPLGAIRGFAQILTEEVASLEDAPPEIAEFAGTIHEASDRALRLVADLLDLSRLETGALDLRAVAVDLGPVVAAVVDRYAPGLGERGVDVRVELAPDAAVVLGDPARIEQVVDQLVSNAARFTPAGSVAVRLAVVEGEVQLEVEDTGIGIADDVLESVFEPFVQEDARVNREFAGTGLGLAIACRLVRQMGGNLAATSAKGEGTTFTLMLPVAA